MFPAAPDVEIYAPNLLFVGRHATIETVVTAKKETKVDFIDVRLTGNQGWRVGSGKNAIVARAVFPDLVARVMDAGVLQPGTQKFTAAFTLPDGMPPTHEIAPAWSRLDLKVHVSIPWWPDGRYRFRLPVRLPPPDQIVRQPVALRSTAAADEPRLEISLASTRLIAGEVVVGSCAVFHVDDRKPRLVELSLVPSFKLFRYNRIRERRGTATSLALTIPAGGAGTSVPFRFELPKQITPSFASLTHVLDWWLVARTGSFFSKKLDVAIPLEVVDASAAARTAKLQTAPILSDQRVLAAFERFAAAQGWRQVHDSDELAVEHDALRIDHDYRGKDGTFLVARVACSLGLGLSVLPSSALREMLSRDIEIEVAEWDRAHHVAARSEAQATPYLTAAVPAVLVAMRSLGPLARWNDSELVFERAITSINDQDLDATAAALARLATALAAIEVAPPPQLAVDLEAWRRLAQRLRGELTAGDLSVVGELDQIAVDLGLEFDDEGVPRRMRAHVGDPAAASELLRAAALAPEHLTDWPADFEQLHLADGVISASLAIAGTADATRTFELVQALRGLIATLDPAPGPYR